MQGIDERICKYITEHWMDGTQSNRSFALDHDIDEKTVRKILKTKGYRIPVQTLYRICEARELKLSEFFKLLNE